MSSASTYHRVEERCKLGCSNARSAKGDATDFDLFREHHAEHERIELGLGTTKGMSNDDDIIGTLGLNETLCLCQDLRSRVVMRL
jgi:hypothetical protein